MSQVFWWWLTESPSEINLCDHLIHLTLWLGSLSSVDNVNFICYSGNQCSDEEGYMNMIAFYRPEVIIVADMMYVLCTSLKMKLQTLNIQVPAQ